VPAQTVCFRDLPCASRRNRWPADFTNVWVPIVFIPRKGCGCDVIRQIYGAPDEIPSCHWFWMLQLRRHLLISSPPSPCGGVRNARSYLGGDFEGRPWSSVFHHCITLLGPLSWGGKLKVANRTSTFHPPSTHSLTNELSTVRLGRLTTHCLRS